MGEPCTGCEERRKFLAEAIAAARAGDRETAAAKLKAMRDSSVRDMRAKIWGRIKRRSQT